MSVDQLTENNDLESVSVEVTEKEENKEEEIEQIVLPEATVGEINENELVSVYESEQKKQDDAIARMKREEEEKELKEKDWQKKKQREMESSQIFLQK